MVWQRVTHLPRTKTEGSDRSLPLSSNGKFGSKAAAKLAPYETEGSATTMEP